MLLTETLNVSDEALRQKHNLPVVLGDTSSNLGARDDAEGHRPSQRLTSKGRKITPLLFTVTLTDHPNSGTHGHAILQRPPHGLLARWHAPVPRWRRSSVLSYSSTATLVGVGPLYASSGSHLIVKLARAPKKDKSELER